MATGKRYYWIRLTESFMFGDVVDCMMAYRDGAKYVMLYEQLCIMAANRGGRLSAQVNGSEIPYDAARIQRETKYFPLSVVKTALAVFKKLGLIDVDASGTYCIRDIDKIAGSETDYAAQKNQQRSGQRRGQSPQNGVDFSDAGAENSAQKSGHECGHCPQSDVDIADESVDKSVDSVHTDIRDKRLDIREERKERRDITTGGTPLNPPCADSTGDERPDFGTLEVYAANNLRTLSPSNLEELISFRDVLPDDLIRHAIDEACASGVPTYSYARSILRRYVDSGFRTVGEAKASDAARPRRGSPPRSGQPPDNPALHYEQREYKDSDFGDGFFIDLEGEYGDGKKD